MNTSFSKRRHISEVNQILEERFLKNVIIEQGYTSPSAINNPSGLGGTTKQDNSSIEKIAQNLKRQFSMPNTNEANVVNSFMAIKTADDFKKLADTYYKSYNRYLGIDLANSVTPSQDGKESKILTDYLKSIRIRSTFTGGYRNEQGSLVPAKWSFVSIDKIEGQENKTINPVDSTQPKANGTNNKQKQPPKWVNCSDNFKLFCYNKTEITRLQGCLGVKKDGYFGGDTQTALNGKFPQFKGVVKKTDIDSICNTTPKGSAYQAEDNIDPTQQVNTPVTNVQSLQPKQQQTVTANTRNIPNPQLSQQTIQQARKDYKKNFNDYKNKYPGLSTNEINRLLGVNPNQNPPLAAK
jgi:hypothetical protein